MIADIEKMLREKALFIDTNLFVLLVVGLINRGRIATFKSTSGYTEDDFDILLELLAGSRQRKVLPNILAEADNLVRNLRDNEHEIAAITIKGLLNDCIEIYRESAEFAGFPDHARFGLTDSILISLSHEDVILTDDFRLAGKIRSEGGKSINFREVQSLL